MSVDGVCVHPDEAHLVWPKVKHWIKRAMERGDLGRFDDVESDVLNGRSILWLAVDGEIIGAAVTQIYQTEQSTVCEIRALGGVKFRRWMHLLGLVEQYAKSFGCNKVLFLGRRGWERMMTDYTATRVVMERTI